MNLYLGFRLARLALLVVLGGIFLSFVSGKAPSRRRRILVGAVLVAAVLGYPNFGFFHPYQSGAIHYWDAFHYFMGAKYLPELGYAGLYEATVVAGRELGAFAAITGVRDLASYGVLRTDAIDAAAVRGRFSPERWQAFKRDLVFFGPRITRWDRLLLDHGYNDPPPRALLLHLIVRRLPASPLSLALLTSLDYVAVAAGFGVVWWAFGPMPTALALAFFALSFFARFDFIGGSVLRWDWIAALLAGVAALARGAGVTAGLLLGYAALARIFPALFLVPLGVKWLQGRLGGPRDPALARCLGWAVGVVLLVTAGLEASGETTAPLGEFLAKIRLHSETAFTNHVGLGSLIAFHRAPWSLGPDGSVYVAQAAAAAAWPAAWVLPTVSTVYLLLALPLILRARPLESIMYAVPLVFWALSPAGYYYSFLVLLILLPWRGGGADPARLVEMALLSLIMAVGYGFEIASDDFLPLFYKASIQMALFFVLWLGFEYARLAARRLDATAALPSLHSAHGRDRA